MKSIPVIFFISLALGLSNVSRAQLSTNYKHPFPKDTNAEKSISTVFVAPLDLKSSDRMRNYKHVSQDSLINNNGLNQSSLLPAYFRKEYVYSFNSSANYKHPYTRSKNEYNHKLFVRKGMLHLN